ncbi:DUF3892 domain-containing protein [Allocoleopsis franciscana]|uniref:Uncharacterized protein n=1 Tax=Allocoleopsis franciscana PCC 7113 TaxID=1173027 RepID=K9WI33_9CYAN|nr:DUF3892 domain-containing protein [Allocoleopsis franciscana]AFZ19858.1 hypothetical protein Mic7113_4157 [Allocoleopsis franciscana PCC 7113]
MPTEGNIICVEKSAGTIQKIGYSVKIGDTYQNFKIPLETAINYCENKTFNFYVKKLGSKVYVNIVRQKDGSCYLRTVADDKTINNLGELDDCRKFQTFDIAN